MTVRGALFLSSAETPRSAWFMWIGALGGRRFRIPGPHGLSVWFLPPWPALGWKLLVWPRHLHGMGRLDKHTSQHRPVIPFGLAES